MNSSKIFVKFTYMEMPQFKCAVQEIYIYMFLQKRMYVYIYLTLLSKYISISENFPCALLKVILTFHR